MTGAHDQGGRFELWRQDDHGRRYLVGTFRDRRSAERQQAELSRGRHKQTYWIATAAAPEPSVPVRNLFAGIPPDLPELPEEFSEILCRTGGVRIERIVSHGHRSAEGFWYDQPTDEFVLLISGRATLAFADAADTVTLEPGDWLEIKARVRHRVAWTDPTEETVWLAVHY